MKASDFSGVQRVNSDHTSVDSERFNHTDDLTEKMKLEAHAFPPGSAAIANGRRMRGDAID